MNNPRLAIRYAKSLVDLAIEKGLLKEVFNDMRFLQKICASNQDFVSVLRSPIINEDKKIKIIEAVTAGRISPLSTVFIKLLTSKKREYNIPEIIISFIDQYNSLNGIHRAKITTATPLSEDLKNQFIAKIKTSASINNVELETSVNDSIIGGFILEMEGRLVDSSILRDLRDIQKQFMNNDYVHKLGS